MNQERLMRIIVAPVISEKATLVGESRRQVVLEVLPDATKAEIKAAGGITFAQDDSAEQTGMPRSAAGSGWADVVVPPGQIGREKGRVSRPPPVASTAPAARPALPPAPAGRSPAPPTPDAAVPGTSPASATPLRYTSPCAGGMKSGRLCRR